MKRLFWVALGAGAGVYAVRQASRTAQRLAPSSVLAQLANQANDFLVDVRIGMRERETQLRRDLGLDDVGKDDLPHSPTTNEDHPFESRLTSGGV